MMKLFDFETIAVNKRGEKTEKQIRSIKISTSPMIWGTVGLILFSFYAFLAALNPDLWNSAWWLVPALEFIPVMRAYAFLKARRKSLNEAVKSVSGEITYSPAGYYMIQTQAGENLHGTVIQRLPPGKYRFHYCDACFSAEPLSSEAEFRSNLNDALASAFGYENNHLENCRRQAGEGKLKTAVGALKINTDSGGESGPSYPESLTVGEVTFELPKQGCNALLEDIHYRAYYHEEEEQGLVKQIAEMVMSRKKNLEAIEAV